MDEELKEKLYDAKMGLMDLVDTNMMDGILDSKICFHNKNYNIGG